MSNIIKGQRVRHETTLKIVSKNIDTSNEKPGPELEDKELTLDTITKLEDKAKNTANMIIQQAEEEASKIIESGHAMIEAEFAAALDKAKNEGYVAGYAEGYDKGELESKNLIEDAKEVLSSATKEKQNILNEIEPKIIEMIISICQKLVSEEVLFNENIILILIRKALKEVNYDTSHLSIKVPSEQYDYVLENKDRVVKDYANPADVEIWKDADLPKGACIIETPFGSIECNIDNQFEEIKKQMRLIYHKK